MDLEGLRAALAASPENIPLTLMVAKAEEERFSMADARTMFDKVLSLDPGNPQALLGIARLLDFTGNTSEAIVRLEDLCSRQPEFAPAWLLRARVSMDEGDATSARKFYDQAVEIDRSQADDDLLEKILSAGPKRSAMTSSGTIHEYEDNEDDDNSPFEGLDAAAALDLGVDFRVKTDLKFADVGGMEKVKDDIRMKIIHPLKNPELFAAYGKKAGGGVLLYGLSRLRKNSHGTGDCRRN